jgi:hypothetical protein
MNKKLLKACLGFFLALVGRATLCQELDGYQASFIAALEEGNHAEVYRCIQGSADVTKLKGPHQESMLEYAVLKLAQESIKQTNTNLLLAKIIGSGLGAVLPFALVAKLTYQLFKNQDPLGIITTQLQAPMPIVLIWLNQLKRQGVGTVFNVLTYVVGGLLLVVIAKECSQAIIHYIQELQKVRNHELKILERLDIIMLLANHPLVQDNDVKKVLTFAQEMFKEQKHNTELVQKLTFFLSKRLLMNVNES